MNPLGWLRAEILARLAVDEASVTVEPGRGADDLVTNAALVAGGRDARAAAERLAAALRGVDGIVAAEPGGPGFVNIRLMPALWHQGLAALLAEGPVAVLPLPSPFAADDSGLFRIQYAHARCHSVLRHAVTLWPDVVTSPGALARAPLAPLTRPSELGLIRRLAVWPRPADQSARLAAYLVGVAGDFDGWWADGPEGARLRILEDECAVSLARLGLARATAAVIAQGLETFGIRPVEELR